MSSSHPSSNAIDPSSDPLASPCLVYPIRVHPHHTDYAGVVWHGSYISWLEESRIEALRSVGVDYTSLVTLGCEIPVINLSVRYQRPVRMGMSVVVKTQLVRLEGVRIHWHSQIQSSDTQETFVTAHVTLVAIDRLKERVLRQFPPALRAALAQLEAYSAAPPD